ncbi:MAG: GrpE nucleotide release factor [Monoraphidium minutum]|nr:MAG: GrpE nucleotide release factor [Monoraphidium minutum]
MEDLERARQRAELDKASARSGAVAAVLSAWLPLLDSFEAAVAAQAAAEARAGPPPEGEARIHAAYRALHIQLLEILKQQGVEVLGREQEGAPFDPELHEAVMRRPPPPGARDGAVLQVLRQGYRVGDRLVRAALVVVAQDE